MFHSVPLNMKVELPYAALIVELAAPSMVVATADTVMGFILATPAVSLTTNTVPTGLTGKITLAGITALAVTANI
jgi:hypothetical protein